MTAEVKDALACLRVEQIPADKIPANALFVKCSGCEAALVAEPTEGIDIYLCFNCLLAHASSGHAEIDCGDPPGGPADLVFAALQQICESTRLVREANNKDGFEEAVKHLLAHPRLNSDFPTDFDAVSVGALGMMVSITTALSAEMRSGGRLAGLNRAEVMPEIILIAEQVQRIFLDHYARGIDREAAAKAAAETTC